MVHVAKDRIPPAPKILGHNDRPTYAAPPAPKAPPPAPKSSSAKGLVIPPDWTFKDRSVADNFEQHVNEQLPFYPLASGMVAHFGRAYLPEGGRMYDLGASTGNITNMLRSEIEKRNVKAVSIDSSPQMMDVWHGVGDFVTADIRTFSYLPYDFGVCFLTLMFLPVVDQRILFNDLYDKLRPGGALVIFERTAQRSGYLSTVVNRLTLAGKIANGVPAEDIVAKELSLSGAQRPIEDPEHMFNENTHEVFRFGDFAGWVATKL